MGSTIYVLEIPILQEKKWLFELQPFITQFEM